MYVYTQSVNNYVLTRLILKLSQVQYAHFREGYNKNLINFKSKYTNDGGPTMEAKEEIFKTFPGKYN